jgi:hypothetical protein
MTQFTLVLPFGLPPPELARDLLRALETPSLASLLARASKRQRRQYAPGERTLPHDSWLADALGSPFAPLAMRGYGLHPTDGHWFIVNPVHIQIARNHLLLTDQRKLQLTPDQSRALFDAAKPYFDELGQQLHFGDANTWFMRGDAWQDLDTASPDAATGQNLTDWMPIGASAKACRKLQNEVQMLWYSHPVNAEREARGLSPVNGFWLWGAGKATAGAATVGVANVPPWLAAIGKPAFSLVQEAPAAQAGAAAVLASDTVVDGRLAEAAIATDWSTWLAQMQRLELDYFAPLLAKLRRGDVTEVKLVLSHGSALLESTTTRMAQRMFWRRPTLNTLQP